VKLKLDFSLPKLVKLRVGLQVWLDVGAKLDVRLRLRGREPLRWKAAIARGEGDKQKELPAADAALFAPARVPPQA